MLNQTFLLIKKEIEGKIEEDSWKKGSLTTTEENFLGIIRRINTRIQQEREKEKQMQFFKYLKPEKFPIFDAEIASRYVICTPLAYLLAKSEDNETTQRILSLNNEINSINAKEALKRINLTEKSFKDLDYTTIMNDMHEEIINIHEKALSPPQGKNL